MCRNIRKLRKPQGIPSDNELYDAALQFVRKISGFREPSRANHIAFEQAVKDISEASRVLLETMNDSRKGKVLISEG